MFLKIFILIAHGINVPASSFKYSDVGRLYSIPLSSTTDRSHDKAQEDCAKMSGSLVSIESEFKLSEIVYMLDPIMQRKGFSDFPIWIGGSYDSKTMIWTWPYSANPDHPIAKEFWCKDYPQASAQHGESWNTCVALKCNKIGTWCIANLICAQVLSYICEKHSGPFDNSTMPQQNPFRNYLLAPLDVNGAILWDVASDNFYVSDKD